MKIDGYEFPDVNMDGNGIARYYSLTNPWMDVIAVVPDRHTKRAKDIMGRAMSAWWDKDKGQSYGDVIDDALLGEYIPHHLIFHDPNDETDEYEAAWEKYIDGLYAATQHRMPASEF